MRVPVIFLGFLGALLLPFTAALDESEVAENTCTKVDPNMDTEPLNIDMAWMGSIPEWYVPMWSKLHAYRITSHLLEQDMASISETQLGKSCVLMKGNVVTGYGKEKVFKMENDGSSLVFKAPWEKAQQGKFSFKLTDNESYILGVNCWEDDQISWAVISTKPTLRSNVKQIILDYVKALGLKKALAQEENYGYGSCKGGQPEKIENDKSEL